MPPILIVLVLVRPRVLPCVADAVCFTPSYHISHFEESAMFRAMMPQMCIQRPTGLGLGTG